MAIEVKKMNIVKDSRGALAILENVDSKRVFIMYDVKENRGSHCNMKNEEIIIPVKGGCDLSIESHVKKSEVRAEGIDKGFVVPAGTWVDLKNFSDDCILVILNTENYNDSDYIRSYSEFKTWSKGLFHDS